MTLPNRPSGALSDEDARKLWDHVRALEVLAEQKAEISEDEKARKALAKADGFDPNIVGAIIKRRKIGAGETRVADDMVRLYELALEDQGALPLEQTRRPTRTPEDRRSVEQVAQQLHGEDAPELVRRESSGSEADDDEALYSKALALVIENDKASTSWLQRQLTLGYNAAARLVERMEREGAISSPDHVGRRTIITNRDPF